MDQTTASLETEPRRRRPAALRIGVALVALLAVAAIIAWRLRASHFQWHAFAAAFKGLKWSWFAFSIFLNFGTYFGRALRWEVMIRPLRRKPSIRNIFDATLIGFTAVVLLGRPGELVRPYLIANKERVPFSSQMAVWLLERIFDLLMVLAIFSFALTRIPPAAVLAHPTLAEVLRTAGWMCGALALVCFALLFTFGKFPDAARNRLSVALGVVPARFQKGVERFVSSFLEGMRSASRRGYVALISAYTVCEWILITGTTWSVFKAFPVTARLGVTDVCIFLGFVAFGSIVQIPGIGGGMQVAGVMALSELLALPVEPSAAVALVFWFVSFVSIVPAGLALAVHEGVNWRKLRHLKDEI